MKKDEGQELTDKALAVLEKKIAAVYKKAEKELKPDIDAYFKQFEKADNEKKKALEAEEITKEEYKQWRIKTMMSGKEFKALRDKIAKRYLEANKEADALVNAATPSIYALNHNYESYYMDCRINGY